MNATKSIFLSAVLVSLLLALVGCKEPTGKNTESENDTETTQPQERERVKAEPGVAKQGRVIGDKEGIIRTPVKALINTKQRAVFEFQVKPAVQLYEAEHGFKPKSHDEFMEKIIKPNNIELPELPEGHEYVWDPDEGELMVDRPVEKDSGD